MWCQIRETQRPTDILCLPTNAEATTISWQYTIWRDDNIPSHFSYHPPAVFQLHIIVNGVTHMKCFGFHIQPPYPGLVVVLNPSPLWIHIYVYVTILVCMRWLKCFRTRSPVLFHISAHRSYWSYYSYTTEQICALWWTWLGWFGLDIWQRRGSERGKVLSCWESNTIYNIFCLHLHFPTYNNNSTLPTSLSSVSLPIQCSRM